MSLVDLFRHRGADSGYSRSSKNSAFKDVLTRIEAHPDCRNLPMISFLILPMQRITRLPLLMDVSELGKTLSAFFSFLHSISSVSSSFYLSSSFSYSLRHYVSGDSGVYACTFTGFWILRKFGFISLLPTAFVRVQPFVHMDVCLGEFLCHLIVTLAVCVADHLSENT